MIENLRRKSPAPESSFRRTAFSDSDTMMEINGKREECFPRKRLGLRRLTSLDHIQSGTFGDGDCESVAGDGLRFKRKKIKFKREKVGINLAGEICLRRKVAMVSLTLPSSSSNHLQEEDNVVVTGTSSSIQDQNDKAKGVTCWLHGSMMSVIGRRREMEDAVTVELGFMTRGSKEYNFFGVYDGHGGSRVAHLCRDRLHRLLAETVEEEYGDDNECVLDWNKVMLESFKKLDEEVNRKGAGVATMGSTAVVAVVGEEEVVVANCGDSRAVLSRGGVALALSNDHKPDRPDELERIEVSGGKVINWNGQRVLGVLATSRSIGDHYLKPYVIPDPEVMVSKRSSSDEFLILASDGLWDVVSNDIACHVVRRCLDGQLRSADHEARSKGMKTASPAAVADAAAVLAEQAIARGGRDNISVVVELQRSAISKTSTVGNCAIESRRVL